MDIKQLVKMVAYQFNGNDKEKILYAIKNPLLKFEADEIYITGSGELA